MFQDHYSAHRVFLPPRMILAPSPADEICYSLFKRGIIYETVCRPHADTIFSLLAPTVHLVPASITDLCHHIMIICLSCALHKSEPGISVTPKSSPGQPKEWVREIMEGGFFYPAFCLIPHFLTQVGGYWSHVREDRSEGAINHFCPVENPPLAQGNARNQNLTWTCWSCIIGSLTSVQLETLLISSCGLEREGIICFWAKIQDRKIGCLQPPKT